MRRAAKTDANHQAVRDHLRAVGWSVCDTSSIGRGVPDLLVARRGFTAVVEVKDGAKPPSAIHLTDQQQRFWKDWPGVKIIAKSPEDAERQLNLAESFQYLNGFGETK
jgi:hypothetical protein